MARKPKDRLGKALIGPPPIPDGARKPDWSEWSLYHDVMLDEAVALSCDIDPSCIRINPRRGGDEYLRRLRIAANQAEAGKLAMSFSGKFLLKEFGVWAQSMGFPIPEEFPPLESTAPAPRPEKSVTGVVVKLPHTTIALESVFKIMRETWSNFDRKNPPQQTNIAHAIDDAMGWKSQPDGKPSRTGQAIAAMLKPDHLASEDRRSRRKP